MLRHLTDEENEDHHKEDQESQDELAVRAKLRSLELAINGPRAPTADDAHAIGGVLPSQMAPGIPKADRFAGLDDTPQAALRVRDVLSATVAIGHYPIEADLRAVVNFGSRERLSIRQILVTFRP
jgi:hypothetical protein